MRGRRYQLKIITSSDNPVLAGNESSSTYGYIGDVKCPQEHLGVAVVDMDFAVVQATQNPIFSGMKINGFDAIGSTGEELFDFCSLDLDKSISNNGERGKREYAYHVLNGELTRMPIGSEDFTVL